jgi:catechol-2,3-dioxygenase
MHEPGATVGRAQARLHLPVHHARNAALYYGDEIALPGGNDPDNRRDFPGGWSGDARNAFDAVRLLTRSTAVRIEHVALYVRDLDGRRDWYAR